VTIASILLVSLTGLGLVSPPGASDLAGRVLFAGLAVPGATVTATRRSDDPGKSAAPVSVVSDDDGAFRLPGLDDGTWTVRIEMTGFTTVSREVTLPQPALVVTLTMRSPDDLVANAMPTSPSPVASPAPPRTDAQRSPDAPSVINGSVVNGAASVFAQPRAFGNNRPRLSAKYTGAVTAIVGSSAWDARPYSFGQSAAPAPSYRDLHLGFALSGPMKVPWLVKNGPQTSVAVHHRLVNTATTQSALMPTSSERAGDFSEASLVVRDPATSAPFLDNVIPSARISPQAAALLAYYPLPADDAAADGNYQALITNAVTTDSATGNTSTTLTRRITLGVAVAFERIATDSVDLFRFADSSARTSVSTTVNLTRRLTPRAAVQLRYRLASKAARVTPGFAYRTNVAGNAGIESNNQSPENWGPPALLFPEIADLRAVQYQQSSSLTNTVSSELSLRRGRHNLSIGGDVRRDGANVSSQPDPRGTLAFTGEVTGNAFADFLLGVPTTSAIAFGDRGTRFSAPAYNAYVTDDFRAGAGLTLNLGMRWEYEAAFTEATGRLSNLDIAPGFAAISQVLPANPAWTLSGGSSPSSLIRPDRRGRQPRLAASWRPLPASSLVLRASYGIYRNLGMYQPLALLLSHQPPFSTTASMRNNPLTPLTLARPFPSPPSAASNTVAVDRDVRSGRAQTWQASVQRDLPGSLTLIVQYDGTKGEHLLQAFLPNSYPAGAINPCAGCPSGYVYITSTGQSLRNAGQVALRRRLHHGLMASVQYTRSKGTDDAATFSNDAMATTSFTVAQDWRDLHAERGPSPFDRPHLLSMQFQYTTGVGVSGGTLVEGMQGWWFKDWTVAGELNTGSGLPFTPVSFTAVSGTGVVGTLPRLTGVPIAPVAPGAYANARAFAPALPGAWGDAGRNSIRGPAQFSFDMSVARAFRMHSRLTLEWRLAAANVLNRVTFATINTIVTSPQFGRPTRANPMRRMQMTTALKF
jgi:trimeric autotransporter adhesin